MKKRYQLTKTCNLDLRSKCDRTIWEMLTGQVIDDVVYWSELD